MVVVPTIPFLRIQMRSRRAGARPVSFSLYPSSRVESKRGIDEESYHGVETRGTERRKENTLAGARLHGVTRKYDAPKASRRGTKRPRRLNPEFSSRGLLGGSTRNTLAFLRPFPRHHLPAALLPLVGPPRPRSAHPIAQPSSQKRAERFAKGVPHTGPHRSPRYLSRQISRLRYTPCNRSHHCSLAERLPSFCPYIPLSRSHRVFRSLRLAPVFSSFVLSRVHSLS